MTDTPPKRRKAEALFNRFLGTVEWLGNLLPHPVTLFALFAVGIVLISGVADWMGLQVPDPRPEGARGRSPDGIIRTISLVSGDGLRRIIQGLVNNFTGFAPLGTVLVAMLGVGVAEKSGLLSAGIRSIVLSAPKNLLTAAVVFAAVLSNTASEMGYVVLIPLAAVVFHTVGRHPLAGLAAAFAGVSGGYSANLLIGTVDPLLAGITTEVAATMDPDYQVGGPKEVLATANWYFMMISTLLITVIGTWVTARIVEPKLGKYDDSNAEPSALEVTGSMSRLNAREKRGLAWALVTALVLGALVAALVIPEDGLLRNPADGKPTPFLKGIVALIFVFFVIPGVVYGRITGSIKSDRDVIDAMGHAMSSMGLYIVLVFFAAQMVAFFKWTNLGSITAVLGADFLQTIGLTGPLVFTPFILMCCFVNLMLGSASAQWAMTAPIFVPMLMRLGYSPELIQAAYRIGDSTTNIVTPMMSYFGLILAFAHRYDRTLGIGTILATMIPYSLVFLLGWIVLFYTWVFGFGLPVGPGAPIRIPV